MGFVYMNTFSFNLLIETILHLEQNMRKILIIKFIKTIAFKKNKIKSYTRFKRLVIISI